MNSKLIICLFKYISINIQQSANQPSHFKLVTILQLFFLNT